MPNVEITRAPRDMVVTAHQRRLQSKTEVRHAISLDALRGRIRLGEIDSRAAATENGSVHGLYAGPPGCRCPQELQPAAAERHGHAVAHRQWEDPGARRPFHRVEG